MRGAYLFREGRFIRDAGMERIQEKLRGLKQLFDAGEGRPVFYIDPMDGSYWERSQFEDFREELRKVSRRYVERDFPTVDPDRTIGRADQSRSPRMSSTDSRGR